MLVNDLVFSLILLSNYLQLQVKQRNRRRFVDHPAARRNPTSWHWKDPATLIHCRWNSQTRPEALCPTTSSTRTLWWASPPCTPPHPPPTSSPTSSRSHRSLPSSTTWPPSTSSIPPATSSRSRHPNAAADHSLQIIINIIIIWSTLSCTTLTSTLPVCHLQASIPRVLTTIICLLPWHRGCVVTLVVPSRCSWIHFLLQQPAATWITWQLPSHANDTLPVATHLLQKQVLWCHSRTSKRLCSHKPWMYVEKAHSFKRVTAGGGDWGLIINSGLMIPSEFLESRILMQWRIWGE